MGSGNVTRTSDGVTLDVHKVIVEEHNVSSRARRVIDVANLVPTEYDYISLGYTGDNLTTVVYKTGGSSGTTVATLTLTYTGSQLDTITKT